MSDISSTDSLPASGIKLSLLSAIDGLNTQLIRCDIVFGMPSQDCRGTGICKLTSDMDLPPNLKKECRHTVAFASQSRDTTDKISLLFFRELLCVDLFRRQFRNGIFDMPEPCLLSSNTADALGLKGQILLPGKYAIQTQGNCFRVDIRCE